MHGGAAASLLVRSTPDLGVPALAEEIVLCSLTRHFTLVMPSPPRFTNKHQGSRNIFFVASCYRNLDKLRPDWPFGS